MEKIGKFNTSDNREHISGPDRYDKEKIPANLAGYLKANARSFLTIATIINTFSSSMVHAERQNDNGSETNNTPHIEHQSDDARRSEEEYQRDLAIIAHSVSEAKELAEKTASILDAWSVTFDAEEQAIVDSDLSPQEKERRLNDLHEKRRLSELEKEKDDIAQKEAERSVRAQELKKQVLEKAEKDPELRKYLDDWNAYAYKIDEADIDRQISVYSSMLEKFTSSNTQVKAEVREPRPVSIDPEKIINDAEIEVEQIGKIIDGIRKSVHRDGEK